MFNISGQNINFVCGLVDKSLDVQINARRIKFVKYNHKYRNQYAALHKLYMHVVIGGDLVQGLGRRSRRVCIEIFCRPRRPLQDVNLGGRWGTHCLREFQYFTHGFRVI